MSKLFPNISSMVLIKFVFITLLFIILSFNISTIFLGDIDQSIQNILALLSSFVTIGFVIYGFIALNRYNKEVKKIQEVAKSAASGILKDRIVHIDESEDIGAVAWSINDMLDQIEAFTRDLEASLNMISQGKSYRKMMPSGLHGDFVKYSVSVNKALDTIATAQSKDAFIQDMLKVVDEYKNNDYRNKIDTTGMQEDIIGLANGINSLGEALTSLSLTNLHNGLALQKGAGLLAQNVETLKDSSYEQSKALEQTTTLVEQIVKTIKNSNQNTAQMSSYAQDLTQSATKGKNLANDTVNSMDEIDKEVTAINDSITVIDKIAFQTNILSLNAAVEAATAGESGKGFAVVAQEVRNLASRSAEAANEIKVLVQKATVKTTEGKSKANEMISGYNHLSENIEHTISLIKEVTSDSKEQESAIVEINESVSIVDRKAKDSVKIATETNIIAKQSNDIAQKIVEDAKSKQVIGKENVHVREKIIDVTYNGPERRKIEKEIKTKDEPIELYHTTY